MIIISHRGNLNGPNPSKENSVGYIEQALEFGFDVEIDVWCDGSQAYLGHDEPQYPIDLKFLSNPKLWCHAKSIAALHEMIVAGDIHCFFHQNDDVTLTSLGYLWTYPGKGLTNRSICVLPEVGSFGNCHGVCTDFPYQFAEKT